MEIVSIKTVFTSVNDNGNIVILAHSRNNIADIGESMIIDSTGDIAKDALRASGITATKWAKLSRQDVKFDFSSTHVHIVPQPGITIINAYVAFIEVDKETFNTLCDLRKRIYMDVIREFEITPERESAADEIEEALKEEVLATHIANGTEEILDGYIGKVKKLVKEE